MRLVTEDHLSRHSTLKITPRRTCHLNCNREVRSLKSRHVTPFTESITFNDTIYSITCILRILSHNMCNTLVIDNRKTNSFG